MHAYNWPLAIVLLAGCSANPVNSPSRGNGMSQSLAAGGGSQSSGGAGNSAVGTGMDANPTAPPMLAPMPMSGGGGAAGAPGVPEGCVVGQFCKNMEPDPTNCGTLTLAQDVEVKRTPGNLLLVFDQSLSMGEPWGSTGMSKLQAAQTAIANAVMTLQDSLTVGALFFPTYACIPALPPPPGGAVTPIEGEGQIPFQPGPMFLQSWMTKWGNASISLGIGTPMQEAFDRADVALQMAKLEGSVAVVAVTDGEPNCFPDPMVTMTPTDVETARAANWLMTRQVKTYVVGLPGANGVQLLNDVAVSGGTMQYIVPDDPAMLEAKLKEVVQETVKTKFDSCSINLTPAADPADKLQMIVVEASNMMKSQVPHMLTASAGWTITPDGKHVEITGDLCSDAMGGRFATITFEYGCKEVPPLKPIQPM